MSEIKIEVEDLKAKLKELSSATQDFNSLVSQFQSNSNGCFDGMNSDFIGIAKKMFLRYYYPVITKGLLPGVFSKGSKKRC